MTVLNLICATLMILTVEAAMGLSKKRVPFSHESKTPHTRSHMDISVLIRAETRKSPFYVFLFRNNI
eukprot:160419-Amorphochlora_amoeboformis.AAC.2